MSKVGAHLFLSYILPAWCFPFSSSNIPPNRSTLLSSAIWDGENYEVKLNILEDKKK